MAMTLSRSSFITSILSLLFLLSTYPEYILSQQQGGEYERSRVLQEDIVSSSSSSCDVTCVPKIPFEEGKHKREYVVGVLANRGEAAAYSQFNQTFAVYLSATAGQRFDPPIRFSMTHVNFQTIFDVTEQNTVDFLYASPSPFACVEAQYGAQSLVTTVSYNTIRGVSYEMSQFAGLVITRADNHDINTILDLKDKVIASVAISGFAAGQLQFREMERAGLSYINDPKQLIFTGDQGQIVNGVLDGTFDAGFVRTGQVERTKDQNGNPVNAANLKIIDPKENVLLGGTPFPFTASTILYPEWNVASLLHVPPDVATEVQNGLEIIHEHGRIGRLLQDCVENNGTEYCDSIPIREIVPNARCDTTYEVATTAQRALAAGPYARFQPSGSYVEVHSMLQETNFISKDVEAGVSQCVRPAELYESIRCPQGHFKKPEAEVLNGCRNEGLDCQEGHQCVCKPCIRAFDVQVVQKDQNYEGEGGGCPKMSICGTVQQTKEVTMLILDNLKREGAIVSVTSHEGKTIGHPIVKKSLDYTNYGYEFTVTANRIGVIIFEIFIDGQQISESPLRVDVIERDCETEFNNALREADGNGSCICKANATAIGGHCLAHRFFYGAIFLPIVLVAVLSVYLYIKKKKREADTLCAVKPEELHFDSPPQVLGQGTYGVVHLAIYRGTQVAVKRVQGSKTLGYTSSLRDKIIFRDSYDSGELSVQTTTKGDTDLTDDGLPTDLQQDKDLEANEINLHKPRRGGSATRSGSGSQQLYLHSKSNSGKGLFGFGSRSTNGRDQFIKEMRLLSTLRHPCVITIMGAVIPKNEPPQIIMEYMQLGSLYDLLHNDTMFMEGDLLLHIIRDIAQGVRFLHAAKPQIVHGDLKSANILVDQKFRAKVGDFGLSHRERWGAAVGTPYWMAPELLRGESSNTAESDMYSFGVLLYELYSRKEPYEGEDRIQVLQKVLDTKVNKRPTIPSSCPPKMAKLMKFLLKGDPALRPTAKELDNRVEELDATNLEPGAALTAHNRQQQERNTQNSDLLYSVFPRHVADVLRAGGKVEPESHETVTIFFSDVVGFTEIASTFDPMKVTNMLDRLYTSFDSLARSHEVFKIETIGDAYMCAANLDNDQEDDHARRIAEFAIDAVDAASTILIDEDEPSKGSVKIRVGFHSGPVVSNVVGSLNPRYGLFGDTVNVSSRMESTSKTGKIHCSQRSAELLKEQAPNIDLELRGEVTVKGKGAMTTYWVKN